MSAIERFNCTVVKTHFCFNSDQCFFLDQSNLQERFTAYGFIGGFGLMLMLVFVALLVRKLISNDQHRI